MRKEGRERKGSSEGVGEEEVVGDVDSPLSDISPNKTSSSPIHEPHTMSTASLNQLHTRCSPGIVELRLIWHREEAVLQA